MGIKVPRITINADYDEAKSFGELRPLSVGYGLHQAWIYATMFGSFSLFGIDTLVQTENTGAIALTFVVSIVVYALTLLLGALKDQRFLNLFTSRKTVVIAAVALSFGTLILLPVPASTPFDTAVQVVSGFITGVSSAVLILQWGTAFARQEQATIVLNTAVAIAIGVAVYAVVLHHIPFPVCGVVAGLLPLAEAFFLLMETPKPYSERNDFPIFQPLPIKRGMFLLKFGVPVGVFGIALGAMRQTSVQAILPAANNMEQILAVLASCCALVLVLITLLALKSASGWNRLFRPLIPFVAVVVFFFPTSGLAGEPTIAAFALLVGYMSFEAMLWICFGELSQEYRLSPVFVFGIGRGVQALTSLAGALIPLFAVAWADFLPMGSSTVIIVLLLAMVVAYALLPGEQEIAKLVLNCPFATAAASGDFEHYEAFARKVSADASPYGSAYPGQTAEEGSPEASSAESRENDGETPRPVPGGQDDAPARPNAESDAEAAPAKDASEAPSPQSAGASSENAHASHSAKQPDGSLWPAEKRGRFKRKCEATANRYLLSARETEVLFFLAKGHNATSIQEQLFISEGTTKTHIRHIYRKLDVHSQQELIQIVENAEID